MNSVVLLRHDKAGDSIKSLPAIRSLIALRPELTVFVVCSTHNASLWQSEPGIQPLVLPSNWEGFAPSPLSAHLHSAGMPHRVDVAVSLLADPFRTTEALLAAIPAKEKWSVPLPTFVCQTVALPNGTPQERDERQNIADGISQALKLDLSLQWQQQPSAPVFTAEDLKEAGQRMGVKAEQWLGLCPVAGLTGRTYPLSHWLKVAESFQPCRKTKVFLFGAQADLPTLEKIAAKLRPELTASIILPSSFRALGAHLARLSGLIAVDSGPLHLGQALGVPSLGVLSGGDTRRWFPTKGPSDVLIKRGLLSRHPSAAAVKRVLRRWEKDLPPDSV